MQWKLWKISETNCSCVGKLSQCFCCLQTKTVRSLNSKCHHSDQPHWRPFHCFVLASLVPLQPWPVCLIQIWVGKEKTFLALLGPAGTSTQANKQVGGTLLPLEGAAISSKKKEKPQKVLLDAGANNLLLTLHVFLLITSTTEHFRHETAWFYLGQVNKKLHSTALVKLWVVEFHATTLGGEGLIICVVCVPQLEK